MNVSKSVILQLYTPQLGWYWDKRDGYLSLFMWLANILLWPSLPLSSSYTHKYTNVELCKYIYNVYSNRYYLTSITTYNNYFHVIYLPYKCIICIFMFKHCDLLIKKKKEKEERMLLKTRPQSWESISENYRYFIPWIHSLRWWETLFSSHLKQVS